VNVGKWITFVLINKYINNSREMVWIAPLRKTLPVFLLFQMWQLPVSK